MKFRNLSIARKLSLGFGGVLLLVSASSVALFLQSSQVQQIGHLNSVSDDATDLADLIGIDLLQTRSSALSFILTGDQANKAKIKARTTDLDHHLAALKTILATDAPQFLADFADVQTKTDQYLKNVVNPEVELATSPTTHGQAVTVMSAPASAGYRTAADDALKALRDKVDAWSSTWTDAQDRALEQIKLVVLALGAASLVLGGIMAWLIVGAIRGPMTALTATMLKLAAGDNNLTIPALDQPDEIGQMAKAVQIFKQAAIDKVRMEADGAALRRSSDEERSRNEAHRASATKEQAHVVASIAAGLEHLSAGDLAFRLADPFAADYEKLRNDFNTAIEKLAGTMTVIMANAAAMHSGTTEISGASDDLARRTEQQAASLEETTAALGEITTTVRKTAEGAGHARQVVSAAKKDAEQSGLVVGQAVDAMGGIEKSSGQISQIISVIDEIAFQTNLLALNAGVEAARAGDAGRGFAVVASEVRALAQRSAEAAKEIKTLINASSQHVAAGVSLVGQTGKALEGILAQITEINDIVVKIASSAQEQATALDQINTAVVQMDQVTQQNAAMVEEATAASHSLAQEADTLSQQVSRFKTGQQQPAGADRSRSAPRKPAARPRSATALKTVGRSGAAPRPAPAATEDNWEEF